MLLRKGAIPKSTRTEVTLEVLSGASVKLKLTAANFFTMVWATSDPVF